MVRSVVCTLCLLTGCYVGSSTGPDGASASADDGADGADDLGDADDGADDDGGDDEGGDDGGDNLGEAGNVPMRRLTRAQYLQSTRDLLQIPQWVPATALPDEGLNEEVFQLPNMVASTVTTTSLGYTRYRSAAKEAASVAYGDDEAVQSRLGCLPASADDACIRDYLQALTEQAFSRRVDAGDPGLAELMATVQDATERLGEVRLGLQWAVITLLQSPEYLYFYPTPDPDDDSAMDDYSKARAIALMFRDSVPDASLLERARNGELSDRATLEAEIDRLIDEMVQNPERRGAVTRFFGEWWSTNVLDNLGKDPVEFPEFNESLKNAMAAEYERWLADILFEDRGDFARLLVSDRLYVNRDLAALYGIEGEFGDALVAVDLPADSPRSGLLTTAGYLSVQAHPGQTSPAARGKFISERLLCVTIPPVPPDVDAALPPPAGPETTRQRVSRHTEDETCNGCHQYMDPMGLSLEEFDAIGRFRTTETVIFEQEVYELPIDASGELDGVAFANSREMSSVVAAHPKLSQCVTRQLLRHSLGRELVPDEAAWLQELTTGFEDSGQDFLSLMREAALHEIFLTFGADQEGQ